MNVVCMLLDHPAAWSLDSWGLFIAKGSHIIILRVFNEKHHLGLKIHLDSALPVASFLLALANTALFAGVFQYRFEVLQTRKGDFTIQLDRKKSIFEGIILLIIQALKLTSYFIAQYLLLG